MSSLLAIFVGGGLGSVARALVGNGIGKSPISGSSLSGTLAGPLGVLAANVLATLTLALVMFSSFNKLSSSGADSVWLPLLAVGFCGGFSTFKPSVLILSNSFKMEIDVGTLKRNCKHNFLSCCGVGCLFGLG